MNTPHHQQALGFVVRQLNTTGYVATPPVPRIIRGTYSFFYLKEGEVLTDVGTDSFLLRANMFLLIPPDVQYSVKWYDKAKAMMGAFEESFITDPSCPLLRAQTPVVCNIEGQDTLLITATMDKLLRDQANPHVAQFTLNYLLNLLSEHFSADEYNNEHIAMRFVDAVFNRTQPLKTITEYAAQFGITPGHLNKIVRTRTGRSASNWVVISRISYAKNLLRDTSLSIIDIAERVGIFDQSYFARFFKKHTGMSPLEYRYLLRSI